MLEKSKRFIVAFIITFILIWPFLNLIVSSMEFLDIIDTNVVQTTDFVVASAPVPMSVDEKGMNIASGDGVKYFQQRLLLKKGMHLL